MFLIEEKQFVFLISNISNIPFSYTTGNVRAAPPKRDKPTSPTR